MMRVRTDRKERRNGGDEVFGVVTAYLLDLGVFGVYEALGGALEGVLLAGLVDGFYDWAKGFEVLGYGRWIEQVYLSSFIE